MTSMLTLRKTQRCRRLRRSIVTASLWLAALALVAPGALGAPAVQAVQPAAGEDELIDRGLALRERREDAAALETFRRAYALAKGARALAQVALAEQALGRWADAEADLTEALGRADDPWIARNSTLLHQSLAKIQDRLGTLQLTGGVPGAEVLVNGVSAGTLPLAKPLRVNAGDATVEVRAVNYLPFVYAVVIPARDTVREAVALVPATPLPAASSPRPADEGDGQRWRGRTKLGLALGAAGVVSAAVGTTFLFVRDSRARAFNDAGCGTAALTPDCASRRDDENSATTWAVSGLVGAAVLGGVSAYLLFWPSGHDGGAARTGGAVSLLNCAPVAAGGVSLSCGGQF